MQKLLANYLFQYKNCAFPQIGSLHIKFESAVLVLDKQKIHAPVSHISFSNDFMDSNNLTEYIAVNKNISFEEAAYQLTNISNEILSLKNAEQFLIGGVGHFTKSANDKLLFKETSVAEYFSPSIFAERVIHPDDSHAILVGDKEMDRNSMTEFYTNTIPARKSKWWLWTAALFLLAVILITVYVNNKNHNNLFGVSQKVEVKEATRQYKNIP